MEKELYIDQIRELMDKVDDEKSKHEKLKYRQNKNEFYESESVEKDSSAATLERIKEANSDLLDEIEIQKKHFTKLETENIEMKIKLKHLREKMSKVMEANTALKNDVNELEQETNKERDLLQELKDENEKFKSMLAEHGINSNTGNFVTDDTHLKHQKFRK